MSNRLTKEDLIKYHAELTEQGYQYAKNKACIVYYHMDSLRAKAWLGRRIKPYWNIRFKTVEQMLEYINNFMNDQHEYYVNKKTATEYVIKDVVKVNDVFYTCWGYEQTNVEYFQVVALLKKSIMIREIEQERNETGFMSGRTMPVVNQFKGKPLTKRLTVWKGHPSIKIDRQYAYPLEVDYVVNAGQSNEIKIYKSKCYSSYA